MLLMLLYICHVLQCRQAKLSYSGKFFLDICFQYGDGVVIREKFNFGQFPIMLKVSSTLSYYYISLVLLSVVSLILSILN